MRLARETILIVEDDPNDILLLQHTFQHLPLTKSPKSVNDGETAIAYLDGRGEFANREEYPVPTLIFLDLKLPGMSGFEVLTWVRQQPRLERAQVVVLTGSNKSLDVYRAYELGASSYLVKPVRPEDLAGLAESLHLPWLSLTSESRPEPSTGAGASQPAL